MKLALYLENSTLSDEAFGQLVGLSQSQVNRIKNGKSKPTLEMVAKISKATEGNVSFADFLGEDVGKENAA